ncbi:hypothetical protein JYQ62_14570 [Nostoc sp. UHCC 0702]|nr:hypothetical protein JYQ62_14570 [Nostoc sp. UHCC 0702]
MSKIIYDVIQRFEVEDGVPRLISTNIQVIQGGEDLLSLATSLLTQMGFYDKFEENRTSQYIGYKLKNPRKGAKRYQLILAQRKDALCISIPREIFDPYLLKINFSITFFTRDTEFKKPVRTVHTLSKSYWIRPSKSNIFFKLSEEYKNILSNQLFGEIEFFCDEILSSEEKEVYSHKASSTLYEGYEIIKITDSDVLKKHQIYFNNHGLLNALDQSSCCLKVGINDTGKDISKDTLFPYTLQVCLNSSEILEEFLSYFAKILMEQ